MRCCIYPPSHLASLGNRIKLVCRERQHIAVWNLDAFHNQSYFVVDEVKDGFVSSEKCQSNQAEVGRN